MKQKNSTIGIAPYSGSAGGWGALKAVADAIRGQMSVNQDVIALFNVNQPQGFDCPGCAWPDPLHTSSFEFCENGAKAVSWEATGKRATPDFFAAHTVSELWQRHDFDLEGEGRLTQPMKYDAATDTYRPIEWEVAFREIGATLQRYTDPDCVEFYTSGRTSNEAAFLYQLFAREYGTNNFPDCSNMCHEPTSVGLPASIGVGKGTVTLEDFEHCDLVMCIGHNPGTNHPRMLATLREVAKRGATIVAFNPLQERGLERFTSPQSPIEMLTLSATELSSTYYKVRVGGDAAMLKGIMKALLTLHQDALARGDNGVIDEAFVGPRTLPIKGADGVLITFAKCCRPIPGDPIIAHVSPGKGLVVHHESCRNIRGYQKEPEKFMPVEWEMVSEQEFIAEIKVDMFNHQGALANLTASINAANSNIQSLNTEEKDGRVYSAFIRLTTRDRIHLANIMRKIRIMPDVIRVNRNRN